ncbi:7981_t:CDS:2 [Cetraspora pellucida]|uniref:uroporphyrinogen-III C-methyltransferase n=1 Tax=Cetraspora pellucida TaxID=1433469 RepID=A0A9N9GQZ5_9GLOM|nr:7981_t:CDS:2 [Cetraspora pellucida]
MSSNNLLLNFSNKIGKLLEDPDYEFNTIIRTGNDSNPKCFKAHSFILRAMSPYFRAALSSKHVMKEGDWTYLEQPNFSPSAFDVILKFMYTGTISMEKRDNAEIADLLVTAQELGLHELVDFLKDHLIQNQEKIIQNETASTNSVPSVDHMSGSAELRSTKRRGRIRLVGAGPGDPNLLTRAAFQAIHEADIILSDKLVPEEVLKLIPSQTEILISPKKFCADANAAQEELNRLGLNALNQGKNVVRLKQGDPFLFGRGGEEFLFYRSHGYTPQVIPGISSCMSAPLLANIPVTHRGVASQFLVCTGTGKQNTLPDIPPYHPSRTTVFLMACHRIKQITHVLINDEKYPPECPCVVIERASCKDQNIIRGTVGTIAEILEQVGHKPPGTLVVGWSCLTLL